MAMLQNTVIDRIEGYPVPVIPGGDFDYCTHPECEAIDCAKRVRTTMPSSHQGFSGVQYSHPDRTMAAALIASYNDFAESLRLAHTILEFMYLMVVGIPKWADGEITATSPIMDGEKRPWKTFSWSVDPDGIDAEWITVNYTIGGVDSDPEFFMDNNGGYFTWNGMGIIEATNSKLEHTFEAICDYYEPDTTASGKFRLHSITPIQNIARLLTPIDDGLDVAITLTAYVTPGRELFAEPRHIYPAYYVPYVWNLGGLPTASPVVLEAGRAMAPRYWADSDPAIQTKIEKYIDPGEWVQWLGMSTSTYLRNEYNAGTGLYEATVHFEHPDMDLTGVSDVRINCLLEDTPGTDVDAMALIMDRCYFSTPDYSHSVGEIDPVQPIATWFCSQWVDLTTAQKAHYRAVNGRCMNQDCPHFRVKAQEDVGNLVDVLPGIFQSRPFCLEKYNLDVDTGIYSNWRLVRTGAPSLASLAGDALTVPPVRYDMKDWANYGASPTWGLMDFATYGASYLVTHRDGLECLDTDGHFADADRPGPGAGYINRHSPGKTPRTNYGDGSTLNGNEAADTYNDPNRIFLDAMSTGLSGIHRGENYAVGKLFSHNDYLYTRLMFPLIDPALTTVQKRLDGWVQLGFWTAEFIPQDAEDGNTAYRMKIMLKSDIRRLKIDTEGHELQLLGTATAQETFTAIVEGRVGIALKHGATTVLKRNGTGESDSPVQVRIGGVNVLPAREDRIQSPVCAESIQGAGAGGQYLHAGRALRVREDADLDPKYWGRIIPIRRAVDCDETANVHDADYLDTENTQNISDAKLIAGQIPLTRTAVLRENDVLRHCDTLEVDDEKGVSESVGVCAAITATAAGWDGRIFDVVIGARMVPSLDDQFYESAPTGVDTAIYPGVDGAMDVLYATGIVFYQNVVQCAFMGLKVLKTEPDLSQHDDIDIFGAITGKQWTT